MRILESSIFNTFQTTGRIIWNGPLTKRTTKRTNEIKELQTTVRTGRNRADT